MEVLYVYANFFQRTGGILQRTPLTELKLYTNFVFNLSFTFAKLESFTIDMTILRNTRSLAIKLMLLILVFAVEMLIALITYDSTADSGFWLQYFRHFFLPTLPFVVLYVVHDMFLVGILVSKRNLPLYLSLTLMLLCAFTAYVFCLDNNGPDSAPRPEKMEQHWSRGPVHPENGGFRHPEEDPMGWPDGTSGIMPPEEPGRLNPNHNPEHGMNERPDGMKPVNPAVFKVIMALLLIGVNIGIEYYKRYYAEKRRLQELEKENLRYRLEYLRYQINPHFFMNTLNNIHALVDISPEKAKESIVELSRLMRHVLYDSNELTVSLSKEIAFLNHYIYLMRLRFTDKVKIEFSYPENDKGAKMPPLLMTTVAENAFKHGISYENESFVRLSVTEDEHHVIFRCVNSITPQVREKSDGGIGLDNIRKRLSLLYGDDYILHTEQSESQFEVLVVLPHESGCVSSTE